MSRTRGKELDLPSHSCSVMMESMACCRVELVKVLTEESCQLGLANGYPITLKGVLDKKRETPFHDV